MNSIPLLSVVALTGDLPEEGLRRGQAGTVVEHLGQNGVEAVLVEFSDEQGRTYAMVPLRSTQIMVLSEGTEAA